MLAAAHQLAATVGQTFGPVDQGYLLEARQMQARKVSRPS